MKKKRMLSVLLVFVLAAGLLSGCGKGEKVEKSGFQLYYLNQDKTELVKKDKELKAKKKEEQIKEALDALKNPEEETEDYFTPFPKGVKVKDFELDGNQLEICFNEKYRAMDIASEVLLRASVVQTLVQIPGISYVSFIVGKEPLTGPDKSPVGLMRAEDFVQNVGSSLHSYQSTTLTLYFANKAGDKLVKETVSNVKYNSNISMDKLIIEQLMKGPASSGAYRTIPENIKVLSVSTKDQICYVNFDKELLNIKTNVKPEVLIYSIVNSVIASSTTSQVQISVNGESDITFGESIKLDKPLSRNLDIVEGEDKN